MLVQERGSAAQHRDRPAPRGQQHDPATTAFPKPLVPIGDEYAILEIVLRQLRAAGFDTITIAIGHLGQLIRAYCGDGSQWGLEIRYWDEDVPLGTMGPIVANLDDVPEHFLVMNGDVLTDLDYAWLVDEHRRRGAEATLHLIAVDDPSRFGVVDTDADGKVRQFVEKPAPGTEPTNLINAGTYVMEPSVLDRIPEGRKVSVERETFPLLVADGNLYAVATDDYWIDAGTPAAYLQANLDLIDGTRAAESHAPAASVAEGARVTRSCVGSGAVIEDGATVVDSVVMGGARVESGATVRDSIVGRGSVVTAGATVTGGTVIGHDQVVAADEVLDGAVVPDPSTWQ